MRSSLPHPSRFLRPLASWRAAIATCALALAACSPPTKDRVALVGVNVFDGTDGPTLEDQVIVVRGTKIETIASRAGFSIPKTAEVVDLKGKWVIPGLIDAHVHVDRWSLPRFLAFGVTSVRDLHHEQDSILALREEAALGSIRSPHLYIAGAMIDGDPAGVPGATSVADANAARRAVDERAVANIPVVKVYTRITPALLKAVVDEATSLNLTVTAHLGLTDAVSAAKLGVHSIEHLTGIPEAIGPADKYYAAHRKSFFDGWNLFERAWAGLDSASLTRVAGELAELHVTLVPTLVLHDTWSRLDDPAVTTGSDLAYVPQRIKEEWDLPNFIAGAGWDAGAFTAFRNGRANQDLFLREFRGAGGIIVAGTDASNPMIVPGASLHQELALLVQAGLSPSDALRAATGQAAALLGADSIGVLAAGKVADLVVLDADPRSDIANSRKILRVMLAGVLMPHDSLDRVARQ
ncbi:MAG: amidohydrolase family protein [Gemmatimonadetes bacterium]|nr:amidohydrolase family protein [Gemmatimonadota bacterium]